MEQREEEKQEEDVTANSGLKRTTEDEGDQERPNEREEVQDCSAKEAIWLLDGEQLDALNYFKNQGQAMDRITRYCKFLTGCIRHKA